MYFEDKTHLGDEDGGLTFRRKIKSMETSRNFKFTHNVDSDMIKIIGECRLGHDQNYR